MATFCFSWMGVQEERLSRSFPNKHKGIEAIIFYKTKKKLIDTLLCSEKNLVIHKLGFVGFIFLWIMCHSKPFIHENNFGVAPYVRQPNHDSLYNHGDL